MASSSSVESVNGNSNGTEATSRDVQPDLKLNLIWPCTEQHIRKYSAQPVHMVTETPAIYRSYVRPFMNKKREEGRLNWVFNILEGRSEQEDVILRDREHGSPEDGFLMLPDLNWDRKTMGSLHLLALVDRRDIWSLRDLKKQHLPWLRYLRKRLLEATVKMYPELEEDQLKLYVHCMCVLFLLVPLWIPFLLGLSPERGKKKRGGWGFLPPTIPLIERA